MNAHYRLCPKCNTQRPLSEMYCEKSEGEVFCAWSLSDVPISSPEPLGPTNPAPPAPIPGSLCPNGHSVSAGDLLCSICGADLDSATPVATTPTVIAGWQVIAPLNSAGSIQRYRVRRVSDDRAGVLAIYAAGAEYDAAAYRALQERMPRAHITELIDFGRWENQAYDVVEEVNCGRLGDLMLDPADGATLRQVVSELGQALAAFDEIGLRHRGLRPDVVLVRRREPLDLVVTGFESARLSEFELDFEAPIELSRYTAPEARMGAVAAAADWWGMGMILLDLLTRGTCFGGADDRLFMTHVVSNGVPIPDTLPHDITQLLHGLLSINHTTRWQWNEVRGWINGENIPVPNEAACQAHCESGPVLRFAGRDFYDPRRWAVEASQARHWDEACDLLVRGGLGLWAEERQLESNTLSALRKLGRLSEVSADFRLMLALKAIHNDLPLVIRGEFIDPTWLLNHLELGMELISGTVPELLEQFGLERDGLLQRLSQRFHSVRTRAKSLEIAFDEELFSVYALTSSRSKLTAKWEERRRDFPDAHHSALVSLLDRKHLSDDDVLLLISASIEQFRPIEEILHDTSAEANRFGLAAPNPETIRSRLQVARRELYRELSDRTANFARCGIERYDAWADEYRTNKHLPLSRLLLLLEAPAAQWSSPPHQEYLSSVLGFFEKKVSGAVLRGPLVRMTIGRTSRIDLAELAPEITGAAKLLESILKRTGTWRAIDPQIFAEEENPENRLRRLEAETIAYQRDTGINGLYLGFPFLLRRERAGATRPRLAPILLWPMKLQAAVGGRGHVEVAFDTDRQDVRLNPAFEGLLGIERAEVWREAARVLLERETITIADVVDAFDQLASVSDRSLVRLPGPHVDVPPLADRCIPSAVLFHAAFAGQSLIEDLSQLKSRSPENSALETLLRVGIAPPAPIATSEREQERFLVSEADPSQEEAVSRSHLAPGLVIQGPPGTGKSQTIVNLLADAIGRRKSVLVVCQKRPALDVVCKRLIAEGLENRLVIVTDVYSDRERILKSIRAQLENLAGQAAGPREQNQTDRIVTATALESIEGELDAVHDAAERIDDLSGRSYRRILCELIEIDEERSGQKFEILGLRADLATKSAVEVDALQEGCGGPAHQWLPSYYEGSALAETLPFPAEESHCSEFQQRLEGFAAAEQKRSAVLSATPNSIQVTEPDRLRAWLGEHTEFFRSLASESLPSINTLLRLFPRLRPEREYGEILDRLATFDEPNAERETKIPALRTLLAGCDDQTVEQLIVECEPLVDLWVAAQVQDSPWKASVDFSPTDEQLANLHSRLERFRQVDARRVQLAAATNPSFEVDDPHKLSEWLLAHGDTLRNISENRAVNLRRFLPIFLLDSRGDEFLAILHRLLDLHAADIRPWVDVPGLAESLPDGEAELNTLAEECAALSEAWRSLPNSPQALQFVRSFTPSGVEIRRFEAALSAFDSAERLRRRTLSVGAVAIDAAQARLLPEWLRRHESALLHVDPNLCAAVSRWRRLFQTASGTATAAERVHTEAQELLARCASLAQDPAPAELFREVKKLSGGELDAWESFTHKALQPTSWLPWNRERSAARSELQSAFRARGMQLAPETFHSLAMMIPLERRRRTVLEEWRKLTQILGVVSDAKSFHDIATEIQRIGTILTAVGRHVAVVKSCPCPAPETLLTSTAPERYHDWIKGLKAALARQAANSKSATALAPLKQWLDESWLVSRRESVAQGTADLAALDELKDVLPQLTRHLFQRAQIATASAECRRVLSVLESFRSRFEDLKISELNTEMRRIVLHHGLLRQKKKLENREPLLGKLPFDSCESLAKVCRSLTYVRDFRDLLVACPWRAKLETALSAGTVAALSELTRDFGNVVDRATARRECLAAIHELRPWLTPDWIDARSEAVSVARSNATKIENLLAALPACRPYQEFRRCVRDLSPLAKDVFKALGQAGFAGEERKTLGKQLRRILVTNSLWGRKERLDAAEKSLAALGAASYSQCRTVCDDLRRTAKTFDALQACPVSSALTASLETGRPSSIAEFLQRAENGVLRAAAGQESALVLSELRAWMTPGWIASCKTAIDRHEGNLARITSIQKALPTLPAFQRFRLRANAMKVDEIQVFARLAAFRPQLSAVDAENIGSVIKTLIRREALLGWKSRIERAEPNLLLDGRERASKVRRLGELADQLRQFNRAHLRAATCDRSIGVPQRWEDITRLRGQRAVRLREFFNRGLDLGLLDLRPVWLMTPDVVGQLLPLERGMFDLVVFDEASQIPVEHAVPSLFRARTAVVSGDEKQMPPSSFFASRIGSDEAEIFDGEFPEDETSDEEREIFEENWNRREVKDCPDLLHLAETALRRTTLQIHYRSEFRELIAFSNAAFYRNELSVPARHPDAEIRRVRPIEYYRLEGTYEKQTNRQEASFVVETLARCWSENVRRPSVGIVTFNLKQKELIEDLLEERAEHDPAFRACYAEERTRYDDGEDMSVFVKNVENVQGDERDWIIFSTTFGRDSNRKFRRYFGVLGQRGGERRLNVAVTRARRKVIIASSMPIDEISDMLADRRRPVGPRDYLQAYLEYARLVSAGELSEARRLLDRFGSAAPESLHDRESKADAFLRSVEAFIRSLGHEPIQTGHDPLLSVDFSIIDPQTGLFGVGVECNPPAHRLARKARARDIWRPKILRRSYRDVHRVTSQAWFEDPTGERERLRRTIEAALKGHSK